jgi:Bacterial conjugation TrbI-like protein
MTQYSVPAKSSDNPDNLEPKTNSSDLELRMARLVGLEEEPQPFNEESNNIIQPSLSEPQSEAQETPTKQSLSSNPFAKVGLVGTATFAMVIFAGGFLSQIMSGGNNKPTTNNIVPAETRSQPKIEPQTQQQEAEIETLKTKLALAEQAEEVKAAQQKLRNAKPISRPQVAVKPTPQVESRVSTTNKPTVVVQRIPTPTKTVYVPQIIRVDRPVKAPQPQNQFTPSVLPPISIPPVTPSTQPSVQITPPPKPDALQEWDRLAKLGSYGQMSSSKQNNTNNTTTIARVDNPNVSQPLIIPRPSRMPIQQTYVPSQVSVRNPKSTAIGSSADAVLTTSVFGETSVKNSGDSSSNNNIAIVRLRQPLKSADGAIALPAKAEFLTKIRSISERGLVQFDIVKVTWEENGKRIERSVSGDALTIRGSGGQPLLASQFPGQGSSFGSDAKLFVLGGIQKAAELYNRPRSRLVPISSTSNTNGVSSSTTTTVLQDDSTRNITAGALDGAIRNIVPEITRRNQMAASRSLERTNIWFLPAGKELQLFVNQEMQF